ncbi:MAG: WbqC family protein [Bacteroidetes bacterium]|nr:WbqC family protein [Bacteroidota bacterium]
MIPLLPTSYLPPVSYAAICKVAGKIILEKQEHYVKQTLRNRTYIYGANGILPLIIPVQHTNLFTIPISDVKISYDTQWQKTHWRSIVSAYRNSAFFEYYEDDFRVFYDEPIETLWEFNLGLLNTVLRLLDVPVDISFTGSYEVNVPAATDLRRAFDRNPAMTKDDEPSKNRYRQVFSAKHGFIHGLSCIDLLFNEGPGSGDFIMHEHH